MDSQTFDRFWATQPRFDPFPRVDPAEPPRWCPQSQPFADWCLNLVAAIGQDPTPARVAYAKYLLLDNYCREHAKAPADHRAETNLDNHPCLHQVMLVCWNELENAVLRRAIPELLPPTVAFLPATTQDPDELYAQQVTGIVIGQHDGQDTAT